MVSLIKQSKNSGQIIVLKFDFSLILYRFQDKMVLFIFFILTILRLFNPKLISFRVY